MKRTVRQNIPFGCASNGRTQPARRAPNGGSARAYLADLSRCNRSYHHGHPPQDSERGLRIYPGHAEPATLAHQRKAFLSRVWAGALPRRWSLHSCHGDGALQRVIGLFQRRAGLPRMCGEIARSRLDAAWGSPRPSARQAACALGAMPRSGPGPACRRWRWLGPIAGRW